MNAEILTPTSTLSDQSLANKMRIENYERFKALVRMHLSFDLDMNTDEFDMPYHEIIYYDKGKLKKWNRLTKKIKACTSTKITQSPAQEDNTIQLNMNLINQLRKLKNYLIEDNNIKQEGIFRLTGSISRQNELKNLISSQKSFDLNNGSYTVHDCATVFKSILSSLSEPLLTDAHYPAHCQIADLCQKLEKNSSNKKELRILYLIQLLILLLPDENRILLKDIIEMLHKIFNNMNLNKMSSDNLATLFSPHLICPKNLPPEALYYVSQKMSKIINFMITKGLQIFELPPKLITDIRAYFLEQKRKKIMSPELQLDESISDLSTVNTVYTFVDREKTAEANNTDATDTALAQLYAHIQSLPESSKKRKLIRQFNKENGQGTPLQLLMVNKMKNEIGSTNRSAKSISDSIKKHILHKSLILRTPKRPNLQTPNAAFKSIKSRVLLQSPAGICNSNLNISNNNSSFILKTHQTNKSTTSSYLLKSSTTSLVNVTPLNSSKLPDLLSTTTTTTTKEKYENESKNDEKIINNQKWDNYHSPNGSLLSPASQLSLSSPSLSFNEQNNCTNIKNNAFKSKFKSEPNLSRSHLYPTLMPEDRSNSSTNLSVNNFHQQHCQQNAMVGSDNCENYMKYQNVDHLETDDYYERQQNDHINNRPYPKRLFSDSLNYMLSPPSQQCETMIAPTDFGNICLTPTSLTYKSKNLITSTPSVFIGTNYNNEYPRKSMSPITKSTQKMPKSMQESIMTPRSRKPVMLTNQTTCQNDLFSFQGNNENQNSIITPLMNRNDEQNDGEKENIMKNSLTDPFKQYLLSRKILLTTQTSFESNQSKHEENYDDDDDDDDDFSDTSIKDIENLDEIDLSESLLHCLNGFNPNEVTDQQIHTGEKDIQFSPENQNFSITKSDLSEKESSCSRKRSFSQSDCNDLLQNKKSLTLFDETSL